MDTGGWVWAVTWLSNVAARLGIVYRSDIISFWVYRYTLLALTRARAEQFDLPTLYKYHSQDFWFVHGHGHGHVHSMGMCTAWAWARSQCLAQDPVTVAGHMSASLGAHVAEHLLAPGGSWRAGGGRGRGGVSVGGRGVVGCRQRLRGAAGGQPIVC